ncbi:DnaB-like helicase C-terminal domain-containing protein [Bacteroides sp. 51]|uniref:replicative DNA helicase n=1 Tax=Bacteroides sp. 51 TaxID=2302938 RepID=UPI0013D04789|nr:DnaB-like helicase C-terminal domain-containing protein [Bacteroides sp. 51]NDV84884.1 DNA helicase [Bacteroides sp. 51]
MKTKAELYDLDVERNLIGSIITYAKVLDDVRDLLCEDCFSDSLHRHIYAAALTLNSKGEPVDILTVTDELRRMGVADDMTPYHVATLSNSVLGDYYYSAQVLAELLSRRRAWEAGQKLIGKALDLTFDLTDTLEEVNDSLSGIFSTPASSISTIREAVAELYENHINRNLAGGTELTGAPTGFKDFDAQSGGLHAGNLIVIAAETSQGKTSFAMSIALSAAMNDHAVAIYSLEMGKAELMARMAACASGVAVNKLLYNKLGEIELKQVDGSMHKLMHLPVYFDDKSTSNIDVIISSIRTMVAKRHIQGVVVDYLQILNVNMKGSNKEQQMAEVARRLKNLAKDLGIWIIALSQLNRDGSNHVPTLNRLRDSGQIAEAADIVVLLYRPEVYDANYPHPFKDAPTKGTAMVNIAKGRNIGLASFLLFFNASTTRFEERTIPIPPEVKDGDNPF